MPADPIRVQTVFLGAVNLADPTARAAYLDQAAGEGEVRERVEALLRAHDAPDSLLDEPIVSPSRLQEATHSHHGASGVAEESLSFLDPPQRQGSLGRIGHYEVLEVLGRGAFGIVFRAFDEVLQRVVAVKVLAPHAAATSPARKRFLREARAAAQIRHENVVQVHAVVEQPLPYLVMEFIPGETLQQRMDRTGPLDIPEILTLGRQIAAGLAAAHAHGIVHRDVKPTNILVDPGPDPRVKLTDFGLARAADDASLTRSGVLAGTPMYMAPEQAKGEALDHRADLFSLGSVLYAMASGRPPFRAPGTMAVLKRVCDDDPRPIREVIPEVPDWLCRIVAKLHAKDPAERYQSAAEVAEVLADCERQLAQHARLKDLKRIPRRFGRPRDWRRGMRKTLVALAILACVGTGVVVVARALVLTAFFGFASGSAVAVRLAAEAEQARARAQLQDAVNRAYAAANRPSFNPAEGWARLFNGKDYSGWVERIPNGTWHITPEEAIHVSGQGGLFTAKHYDDFHLFAEVRTLNGADSGVFFRCDPKAPDWNPPAFEAMINAVDQRSPRTGSLMDPMGHYFYGEDPRVPDGEWFTYEVIAAGDEITLKVNGKTTLAVKGHTTLTPGPATTIKTSQPPPKPVRGPIGLQFPGHGRAVEFRNLWIKPLKPAAPPASSAAAVKMHSQLVESLKAKAAAVSKRRDAVKAQHEVGRAPRMEFLNAEVEHLEARLAVAEAKGNQGERIKTLMAILNTREEQRAVTEQMVKAGVAPSAAIAESDAKLADAKTRLLKAELEPGVLHPAW